MHVILLNRERGLLASKDTIRSQIARLAEASNSLIKIDDGTVVQSLAYLHSKAKLHYYETPLTARTTLESTDRGTVYTGSYIEMFKLH